MKKNYFFNKRVELREEAEKFIIEKVNELGEIVNGTNEEDVKIENIEIGIYGRHGIIYATPLSFLKGSDTNIKIKVIYDEAKEETINLYDVDEDHYGVLADMITDLLEVK